MPENEHQWCDPNEQELTAIEEEAFDRTGEVGSFFIAENTVLEMDCLPFILEE